MMDGGEDSRVQAACRSLPGRDAGLMPRVVLLLAVVALSAGCERWPWEAASAPPSAQPASQNPPANPAAPAGPRAVSLQERVATVNDAALSTTDMELAVVELKQLVQAYHQTWQPLSTDDVPDALDLHDVVNNLVDSELKAQDARTRGLDRKTDVAQRFAYLQRGFYAQEWDRWQRERAVPTEEEVHKFYEEQKAGFLDPERIRVRQIVNETLSEAEAVRAKAVGGTDFTQLAREFSVGAGKEQGGDIGWCVREVHLRLLTSIGQLKDEKALFEQLEPVAFALEVNQVSMPVKGPDGRYYIVQVSERKPARQRTELEVHDFIKELLTLQKLQQELQRLRDSAKVERFPERLKDIQQ